MPDKYSLCPTGLSNRKDHFVFRFNSSDVGELTQMAAKLPKLTGWNEPPSMKLRPPSYSRDL